MRASKARFAFTVVSTMLTCLLLGLSAMSSSLPTAIVSKASEAIGLVPIESSAPSYLALLLSIVAIFSIYRFGSTAVINWEAPQRVSETDLAEKYLDNSIAALFIEQTKLFYRGQPDPLASDAVANWKEKVSEPPAPVPTSILLRDMFVEALRNGIHIPDDGWREEGRLWVGKILGLRDHDTEEALVLICDSKPNTRSLENRLESLMQRYGSIEDFSLYALYMSDSRREEKLGTLEICRQSIRVLSSRELILMNLELVNYARLIIEAFEETQVGGTTATLKNSYVELNVLSNNDDSQPEALAEKIATWLNDTSGKQIAITGEYGQGKSTALLKFCYDWAKRFVETQELNERVPLLIELRGQSPSETDPLGFLSNWCTRYGLSPRQVHNLIKSGDAVVIFEGFDELRNSGQAYYRHQHFNALWKFAFPGTKVLFTGRPNFFLDQAEANRTLRNQEARKLGGDLYTDIWKLEKLTAPQISEACRNYDPAVANGIVGAVEKNRDFLDIVSRPSMLPVVATIWNEIEDLQAGGNQLTGAALIEKYIQAVFARKEAELERDQKKLDAPTGSRYLVLPKQIREFLTICVAWRMSGLRLKNTIPRSEITEMIREIYDHLLALSKSLGVSAEIAEGMIDFDKRYKNESTAERIEAIAEEICSSGLLVPDPAGGSSNLRFPHKQFFEFLIAKAVAIKSNSAVKGAGQLLDKCSSEANLSTRLISEPNSVVYLTECVGPNMQAVATPWQRFLLRLYVAQLIFAHQFIRLAFRRKSKSSEEVFRRQFARVKTQSERLRAMERLTRMAFLLTGPVVVFWILLIVGIGFFEIQSRDLIGNLRDALETHPFSIFAIALPISMAAVSSNFLTDDKLPRVVFAFLNAHWERSGEFPKSRLGELRLALTSLSRGQVQFSAEHKDTTDYERFLYPAAELGNGLD
ncbi:NACHT domain-containing NTPase [Ruegeria sp. AU67]|uniref:NACHT domain-containing protein n=1 Tax=Ruegeria sp. AU67 TaxID=2108530 RepID=UPI00135778AF|nr:NACHT domain-containing protein [Ruegeria sp. AU67]